MAGEVVARRWWKSGFNTERPEEEHRGHRIEYPKGGPGEPGLYKDSIEREEHRLKPVPHE